MNATASEKSAVEKPAGASAPKAAAAPAGASTTAYVLAPHVALRSWERVPYAYAERFVARPRLLSAGEFACALACDGARPLPPSADLDALLAKGLAVPCAPGAAGLTAWQRHRACPNRVTPWMGLEITGRCNYNCRHCFNATDNRHLLNELSLPQVEALLDDAARAGVNAVLVTGGEPLLHPDFKAIVAAVYERGMFVHELNTNGRFLTDEILDFLTGFGCGPDGRPPTEIKISFDCLGHHDWMRDRAGAEGDALRAIGLSVARGFNTRVQTNVNRANRDALLPTLRLLDQMGVACTRVICTVATPRWELNAPGMTLTWDEYLDLGLATLGAYAAEDHAMDVDVWNVAKLMPRRRAYQLHPVRYCERTFKESRPCCATINGMVAVAADGQVYPCMQCSGTMAARGVRLGSVFEEGLPRLLREGVYHDMVHATVGDRLRHQRALLATDAADDRGAEGRADGCGAVGETGAARSAGDRGAGTPDLPACPTCPWLTWCGGGCPALGMFVSGDDFLAPDRTACTFFCGGWPARFERTLPGWACINPVGPVGNGKGAVSV